MIELRRMRYEDVPEVGAIERMISEYPWTDNIFHDCITVGYHCWVFADEAQILGFGMMSIAAAEAHILNFAIKPSEQRQGLGFRMMNHLIQIAREAATIKVYLEVRVSNAPAIELYNKLHFKKIGYRCNYYQKREGREDALVLGLIL